MHGVGGASREDVIARGVTAGRCPNTCHVRLCNVRTRLSGEVK
jgi:hypothetical protein